MSNSQSYWERPDKVEEFAGRAADRRLLTILDSFDHPPSVRVLDVGCAGGRNTVVLAEHGFDVHATDASGAMVERTRSRVAAVLGSHEAERRVRQGRMADLEGFTSESFELVVALGVYHSAATQSEFDEALSESARVLVPEGQLLVASFHPDSEPMGEALRSVEGEDHLYDGFDSGPLFLLKSGALDAVMSRQGLYPVVPTETVVTPTDKGRRVTVNALYRKARRDRACAAARLDR
jgi:cyclopropane fatty-acyl-phospholipid synthase-like methyltransferase